MGEQMDRAKRLIDAIPADGAMIVTLTNDRAKWLMTGIRERRGFEFARCCDVVGIHRMSSCDKLLGRHGSVLLDDMFERHAPAAVRRRVDDLVAGINGTAAAQQG